MPSALPSPGFLAGYRGLTREAYALDLRQFVSWCERHERKLFAVHRADIELYARALEEAGRARATVARRLCTVAGFYRYAEEEGRCLRLRQSMSAGRGSTTNPTPSPSTVTRSARSWWLRASAQRPSTPSSRSSP